MRYGSLPCCKLCAFNVRLIFQHGKDFEAIQNNIALKYKKKGKPASMVKNKEQVRHFYYRTWHKITKYIDFDNGECAEAWLAVDGRWEARPAPGRSWFPANPSDTPRRGSHPALLPGLPCLAVLRLLVPLVTAGR